MAGFFGCEMTRSASKTLLKIGLVLADPRIPAWFAHALDEISKDGSAEVQRVILLGKDHAGTAGRPILYSILDWIDRALFSRGCDPLAWKSLPDAFKEKTLYLKPQTATGLKGYLSDPDASQIRRLGLDVLISVGVKPLSQEFGNLARYGAWEIIFGDERGILPVDAGFARGD